MSFDNLNPDELIAAKRQVEQYGERSAEIVKELVAAYANNDHHHGGELVREMYNEPDKLLLVVGMLTTAVVRATTGPLATPEELGIDTAQMEPQAWQVGVCDQMEAAAAENDFTAFAQIAMDAQLRAYQSDFLAHREQFGHWPDINHVMRGYMIMDRITVIALAAEALRRLVLQEVEEGR